MRLLLVEDEPSLRESVAKKLHRAGYETDDCGDGETALEMLAAERYDLVLLDLNLPRVDGMTVLRTLRKTDLETPVLILSARSEIADKVEGLDTYEQIFLALPGRHGEAVAERQHTVEHIALLELSELTSTVAHHCNEQPELIIFTIHEIDGDRTAKHGSRRMVYSYFYELARQDFRQRFLIGKLNQNVLIAKRLYRNHLEVENIFFHLIANF